MAPTSDDRLGHSRPRARLPFRLFDDTLQPPLRGLTLRRERVVSRLQHRVERLVRQRGYPRRVRDAAARLVQRLPYQPGLEVLNGPVQAEVLFAYDRGRQPTHDYQRTRAKPRQVFGVLSLFQKSVRAQVSVVDFGRG